MGPWSEPQRKENDDFLWKDYNEFDSISEIYEDQPA
jgi:hypothetical protein